MLAGDDDPIIPVGNGRLLADTRPAAPDSGAGSGQAGAGWERWLEGLRTAEELLPRGEPLRQRLRAVRGGLEAARRRDPAPPRYELLLEHGVRPLGQELLLEGREHLPGLGAVGARADAEVDREVTQQADPVGVVALDLAILEGQRVDRTRRARALREVITEF